MHSVKRTYRDTKEFSNCLGDLKKNIEYIKGMEIASGNHSEITAEDISRILNVPVESVREAMR